MHQISSPYYLIYESKLRKNLQLISTVMQRSGAEVIMAFKANALWRTFPIFREFNIKSTASSLYEMQLANDELHCLTHTYTPAYTPETINRFINGSSHLTFNSVEQYLRFKPQIEVHNTSPEVTHRVSAGLRINPMLTIVNTDIYNPCAPGSRFGITAENLTTLPEGIEGFHFHALCESTSYDLQKVLDVVEKDFGHFLPKIKWLNMGGGHLMTRADYDVDHLVNLLTDFRSRFPNLRLILEPGSAFCWQTGDLITTVVDVVENRGIRTAIIDASFTCHMPDCLEMPYKPKILEAMDRVDTEFPTYRIGGNSCLSGDFIGDWSFEKELKIGDRITFFDMNHYTTVKTHMFNGIAHPSLILQTEEGTFKILREFTYDDYKRRMS